MPPLYQHLVCPPPLIKCQDETLLQTYSVLTHPVTSILQVQVPGYLRSLPIPSTAEGFSELTRDQWLQLVPFILFLFIILYLLLSPFCGVFTRKKERRPRVNRKQKLNEAKVADSFDMEDLDKKMKEKDGKISFCRCWKSNTVRFCLGTIFEHNYGNIIITVDLPGA